MQPGAILRSSQGILKMNHRRRPFVACCIALGQQLLGTGRAGGRFFQCLNLLFSQSLVSVSQEVEQVHILRFQLQCTLKRYNFRLYLTGQFLCRRQPGPDVRSIRLRTSRSFQIGYGPGPFAHLAVVNAEEKIRARECGLDLERPAELSHGFRYSILQLVNQTKVHVNLGESRSRCNHGLILTLGRRVILAALRLLGGSEVGVNR